MQAHFVTIFPSYFEGPLSSGILYAAVKKDRVRYNVVNLRDFARDKHRTVDDYPYGGGPGMILMAPPLVEAVESITSADGARSVRRKIVFPTPGGRVFTQDTAADLARMEELVFICGRYKGVDERVLEILELEQISLGDYVVSGGEAPALVILEAVVRLLPEVLGDKDSADTDSFSESREGRLDSAYYTRPEIYRSHRVPETLLSGHHAAIEEWRRSSSMERTERVRPDLSIGKKNSPARGD